MNAISRIPHISLYPEVLTIQALLESNLNARDDSQKNIEWRGRDLLIRNNKLLESILDIENQTRHLNELPSSSDFLSSNNAVEKIAERMALYDVLVGEYWTATGLARKDLDEQYVSDDVTPGCGVNRDILKERRRQSGCRVDICACCVWSYCHYNSSQPVPHRHQPA